MISLDLDCDAVELVLRSKSNLSGKLQLLFYLLEAEPDYQHVFVNRRISRLRAFSALAHAGVMLPIKWCKGFFTIKRHALV